MALAPAISNAAAKAMLDALTALINAGAGAGKLRIYSGTKPTNPDVAIGAQVLLAELTLSDPAFTAATDANPGALATASAISDDTSANNTGTATWFRVVDSNDVAIIDGSVGTSSADLILDDTALVSGQTVKVTSWTITQPET